MLLFLGKGGGIFNWLLLQKRNVKSTYEWRAFIVNYSGELGRCWCPDLKIVIGGGIGLVAPAAQTRVYRRRSMTGLFRLSGKLSNSGFGEAA